MTLRRFSQHARLWAVAGVIIGFVPTVCHAQSPAVWTFSTPPRGSHQRRLYSPLVRYLAQVTGHPIRFVGTDSWMVYSVNQARGRYTLIFDGPTFTGWRDQHLHYRPLVRLGGYLTFDVVTTDPAIRRLHQLDGEPVCANALPNLATMVLMHKMLGIARPYLVPQSGIGGDYRGLLAGTCVATVLPIAFLAHHPAAARTKIHVLYQSRAYRNLALSVSPAVPAAMRRRIRAALLSPQGLKVLRQVYPGQPHVRFRATSAADYIPYEGALDHLASYQYMIPAKYRS